MLRRAACVANAILAALLLDFLGDGEDRRFSFLALATAEVTVSLGSTLALFRCGSLVGESTFLGTVAFVNETFFGVVLFAGTFRVGVVETVSLDRAVRDKRNGEGVELDAKESVSFLVRVRGVPFPLISLGKLLTFF
jgi:hypothetical protein